MQKMALQGPPFVLGQSNQLCSGLIYRAEVKFLQHFFRLIYRLQTHVSFIQMCHIGNFLEHFLYELNFQVLKNLKNFIIHICYFLSSG